MLLYNLYEHSSIHSAFQNMQAAHAICTYASLIPSEMLAFLFTFELNADSTLITPSSLAQRKHL